MSTPPSSGQVPLVLAQQIVENPTFQNVTGSSGGGGAWRRRASKTVPAINKRKYKGQQLGVEVDGEVVPLPLQHLALLSDGTRVLDRMPLSQLAIVEIPPSTSS